MTFGPTHYVPILKLKRGEKDALAAIPSRHCSQITPLLELVVRKDDGRPFDAHLDNAFKGLSRSLQYIPGCFLDVHEIAPDGPDAAALAFARARSDGLKFTPVVGISRTFDTLAALGHRENGLAIRLTRGDLERGGLGRTLNSRVGEYRVAPSDIDLILDLGSVEDMIVDGVAALTSAFLAEVPDHVRWRTLTVSSCAFPKSMGVVDQHSHTNAERTDWIAWRDHLFRRRGDLSRLPTFSDGAIQHPKGVEGFDPAKMSVSPAVRYTLDDAWLLVKGENTKKTPAKEQFPNLAERLVYGDLRANFAGASHCAGCSGIKNAADGVKGFGSAQIWRRLGTIHHLTKVMEGLRARSET